MNFFKKINTIKIDFSKKYRGKYGLENISLNSVYPFGVIKTKVNYKPECEVIVYPENKKPNQDLLNQFNINKFIDADEFEGIDEFKNGDSYSKIAWKKSTLEKKYIKIFKDKQKEQKFILDLDKYREIDFELLLSYSVYIIKYYYLNKLNLTLKHKSNIFILDNNEKSLNQIYKYLANVKN